MKMLKFIITNKYNDYMDSRTVMPPAKLYEITQGEWNMKFVGETVRKNAEYALAVANGVVLEVYKIDKHKWEKLEKGKLSGRWVFQGGLAEIEIREQCIGKKHLNKKGDKSAVASITISDLR